jgi:hypothetical protein
MATIRTSVSELLDCGCRVPQSWPLARLAAHEHEHTRVLRYLNQPWTDPWNWAIVLGIPAVLLVLLAVL